MPCMGGSMAHNQRANAPVEHRQRDGSSSPLHTGTSTFWRRLTRRLFGRAGEREVRVRGVLETAESALRESEHRFRAIFDQAGIGMAQSDLDGRWLLVNERLLDLYG